MKRKYIVGLSVLLMIILLLPTTQYLKDGGTVEYHAILYKVKNVHQLNPDIESEKMYIEGVIIEILGVEIFNNVEY